jgi:uncharacterized protein YaaW (UPF0174 family)
MPKNDRLYFLMDQLDEGELLFLLQNGLEKKAEPYKSYSKKQLMDAVSLELREAASHSFANAFRPDHDLPYKQILIDVANKLSRYHVTKYKLDDDRSEEEIEKEILRLFDLEAKKWWSRLSDEEKNRIADEMSRMINAKLVSSVNRRMFIKYRIKKELTDSVITKGIVFTLLAISGGGALGVLGGSLLTKVGWVIASRTAGLLYPLKFMNASIGSLNGKAILDLIGGFAVALSVFVPSTLYFHADTNYKKTIPTVIMLLSKIHLNKVFGS